MKGYLAIALAVLASVAWQFLFPPAKSPPETQKVAPTETAKRQPPQVLSLARAEGESTQPMGESTQPILIDWADHARDPKALAGNPIYVNSLYCTDSECRFTSVSVGSCPLHVDATTWETRDGDLAVSWGREGKNRSVEIEVPTPFGTIKRRLVLRDLGYMYMVEAGSGAVITTRPPGGGPVLPTEIVAYTKDVPGLPPHPHWVRIDTGCQEIAVRAARRNP